MKIKDCNSETFFACVLVSVIVSTLIVPALTGIVLIFGATFLQSFGVLLASWPVFFVLLTLLLIWLA